jgi:hypothetical protein
MMLTQGALAAQRLRNKKKAKSNNKPKYVYNKPYEYKPHKSYSVEPEIDKKPQIVNLPAPQVIIEQSNVEGSVLSGCQNENKISIEEVKINVNSDATTEEVKKSDNPTMLNLKQNTEPSKKTKKNKNNDCCSIY